MVSSLWWLVAATGYLVFALTRPGPAPNCEADGCWSEQGLLLLVGIFLGLPVMLIGMTVCAVTVGFLAKRAKSAVILGTGVAWAGISIVLVTFHLLGLL